MPSRRTFLASTAAAFAAPAVNALGANDAGRVLNNLCGLIGVHRR